ILPENSFEVVGRLPKWFFDAMGLSQEEECNCENLQPAECFPFLEYFLTYEVAKLWEQPGESMVTSGLWIETDKADREYYLEASALWVKDEKVLMVRKLDARDNNFHNYIQTGREQALACEKLNKSKQLLKSFMAEVSHELRTPLTAILGYSKLISDFHCDNLSEKQLKCLTLIHLSGRRLLSIINTLLDLTRIEAGKTDLVKAPLSPHRLFEDLEDMVTALIREKDITFRLQIDGNFPRRIITDGEKLHRILINLLGNAAKFTRKGEILLRVCPQGQQLYFFVKDTGIGISKEHQVDIFESYARVEDSRGEEQRREGSSGLGLNLCKQLVTLLGGEITLRSEKGKGAEFFFYIPLEIEPGDV
ncbi:MAG: hypothetical protein GY765_23470, partial [bacterium]|nr:hypothetical protein [bacterium]